MASAYRKFAHDVGVIGITNIALGIRSLVLIPVLTKALSTSDYGLWTQSNVTMGLIMSVAGLGLPYAMTRFLAAKKDKGEIQEEFYTVSCMVFFSTLAFCLILAALAIPLGNAFFDGAVPIVRLTALIILLSSMDSVYLSLFRTFRQMKRYSLFSLIDAYGQIGLMAYLAWAGQGIFNVIAAAAAVKGILLIVLFFIVKSQIGIKRPHYAHLKKYLAFSLPLLGGVISTWVLTFSDRYVIAYFLGAGMAGVYSVAYTIGCLPAMASEMIGFVLPPTLSKLYDEDRMEEVKTHLRYSLKYFLALAIPFIFGAFILEKRVLMLFATPEIATQSSMVMPIIAISTMLGGIYTVIGDILYLVKKVKIVGIAWVIAAVFNLIFTIVIVPYMGIKGAAITTTIAHFLALIIIIRYAFREFTFPVDWLFVIKSITASIIMSLVIWKFNPIGTYGIIATITAGIIVYAAALFLLKSFQPEEINFFKRVIRREPGKT